MESDKMEEALANDSMSRQGITSSILIFKIKNSRVTIYELRGVSRKCKLAFEIK